jgi:hypothetical protein
VGDGGPRLDRGTNACGDGVVELDAEDDEGKLKLDEADPDVEDKLGLE